MQINDPCDAGFDTFITFTHLLKLSHLSESINTDTRRMRIQFKAALTDPILKDSRNVFRIFRQDGLPITT